MDFLLTLHGHMRWLIVATWVVGAVLLLGGVRVHSEQLRRCAFLASGFLFGLLAFQFVLGLVLFVWKWQTTGTIPHYRWEHVTVMLTVLLGAHLPLRWRHRPAAQWWRRTLWLYLALGLLLYLGVSRLPKGWLG